MLHDLTAEQTLAYRIAWPPKPTPRIKQRVASYHTTEVVAHKASYNKLRHKIGCHGNVPQYHRTRHDSYGPSELTTQMASRSVQPYSHKGPQGVPILYNGTPLPPSKLPLSMGGSGPHLIHGFLGPPESTTQMASQSVQPFLQDSLVWQTDRPTDHATPLVTIGRIYVYCTAMRPNNNNNNNYSAEKMILRFSVHCSSIAMNSTTDASVSVTLLRALSSTPATTPRDVSACSRESRKRSRRNALYVVRLARVNLSLVIWPADYVARKLRK